MSRTIAEIAPDTEVLSARLARLKAGEVVTYDELSQLIGRDVRATGRSNLASARRKAEREAGIAIECVRNIGLKRIDGDDIPAIGESATVRIRRAASKAAKRMLRAASTTQLSNEALIRLNTRASLLGAIAVCTTEKRVSKLQEAVAKDGTGRLPVAKTLEMFKS